MSNEVDMRPLWDAILDVYDEFAKVCTANGLRFFVGEGNAIGALRHGGFIPWDDDMDVMMPRPDYESFREICSAALPPHLKHLDWRNVPEHLYMFGKVQDCREDVLHEVERKIGRRLADGIYVDILVIDGMPDGRLSRSAYKARRSAASCMRRRFTSGLKDWRWRGKFAWLAGWVAAKALGVKNRDGAFDFAERAMKSAPFDGAKTTWREGALARTTKMEIPARVWQGSAMVKFEGREVPLPAGYDEYLRMQYGDYMTPPAKAGRVSTHERREYSPWYLGPTGKTAE